jgi:hypothetical protein
MSPLRVSAMQCYLQGVYERKGSQVQQVLISLKTVILAVLNRAIRKSPPGMSDHCGTVARWSRRREARQQRERHCKLLSYPTGAPYVLSVVSVLVVAQPSSEVPEGLSNYPVIIFRNTSSWYVCERILVNFMYSGIVTFLYIKNDRTINTWSRVLDFWSPVFVDSLKMVLRCRNM